MSWNQRILVTGGSGFIGSSLARALTKRGAAVRCFDNGFRGSDRRFAGVETEIERITGDIRDAGAVRDAVRGIDAVYHLACINGTEFFYSMPDQVLEVAVKGMIHLLDACIAEGVKELVLASSSEVYQTPPVVPTDETVPLSVPDPLNPRYSYGGGKIISELLALHYGQKYFDRVLVFRPHNVYGPDMGREHVIPQFALRIGELARLQPDGVIPFPIQGTGSETRAFVYIDDAIEGILHIAEKGSHLGIYHVGTDEEIAVAELARMVAACHRREIEIVPGPIRAGGTARRCPDISRLRALGYEPRVPLREGVRRTVDWYDAHRAEAPGSEAVPTS